MFFALAALCFLLLLFGVSVGTLDLLVAGLLFIALGHMWPWSPWPNNRPS